MGSYLDYTIHSFISFLHDFIKFTSHIKDYFHLDFQMTHLKIIPDNQSNLKILKVSMFFIMGNFIIHLQQSFLKLFQTSLVLFNTLIRIHSIYVSEVQYWISKIKSIFLILSRAFFFHILFTFQAQFVLNHFIRFV